VNEHDLVERCREGNREAQRELYDRTSERIYRLLLKMTANPDDAFDLAQETYLKAFTRISQFDGRSSVATWLYRVAVNEALQFLRRAKQKRMKLEEIGLDDHTGSAIDQSAVKLDVNEALAALTPDDRSVLLLRYQEGLDYRAIAEVMGCAAGTVASRLNRARGRLRGILRISYASGEEEGDGEHPKDDEQVSHEPRT
jgi:RNA polymerase sigma-70 factor (ECF subfamily)